MRIAMVGSRGIPTRTGGVERVVENLASELRARGHDVLVYARRYYVAGAGELPEGVIVTGGIRSKHLDTITHTATAMFDLLRRKADVVHVHSPAPALLSWVPAAARLPVVLTVHAPDWRRDRWSLPARAVLRAGLACGMKLARAVTAVSQPLADELAARYGRHVHYVPNGVPAAEPQPARLIRRWGLREDGYVLNVGRIVPEKRLDLLLRAWPDARDDRPLVVVGDEAEPAYARRCRRLADGHNVMFLGAQSGQVLAELYSNAGLVVQPSALEGMSMVLLEAAAYGRCVLAADIPENRLPLENCALYFTMDDPDELAAQVHRCLGEADTRCAYGRAAQARARELSVSSQADRMEELYGKVLGL